MTAVWDGQVDHIYYYGYNSSNEYGLNELYYNNGWYQGSPPATMSPGWLSSAPGSLTGVSYVFGASSSSGMQWDENYAGWHSSNISGTGCNGASTTASYLAGGTTYSFCASGGHIWLVIGNSEVYEMNLTVAAEQSDNSFPSNSPMWGFSTGGACWLYYIDTDSAIHELYSGDCAGSSSWDNYQITNTGVVAN